MTGQEYETLMEYQRVRHALRVLGEPPYSDAKRQIIRLLQDYRDELARKVDSYLDAEEETEAEGANLLGNRDRRRDKDS